MSRFWPLWLGYLGVWFVIVPMSLHASLRWNSTTVAVQRMMLSTAKEGGIVMGAITAVLAVMAVWSFLYNARSVSGTASLPIRREGVFLSVSLAGLLPLLAANVLIVLMSLAVMALHGVVDVMAALIWLAVVSLLLLFFYGFALLCAQLTGNILVLPVVYAVLNFTACAVEALITTVCSCFVYGLEDAGDYFFSFLSPCVKLFEALDYKSIRAYNDTKEVYEVIGYCFEGWGAVAAYALAGVVLAALALWLYRRRRMESAGDVVAIDVLKPVFKYCLTFGCALVIGIILYSIAGVEDTGRLETMLPLLCFMLLGAFIGYFAAEMLIRKSFAVWRGHWAGLGVSLVLIALFMFAMEFDLFGYERRVPEAEDVEAVTVRASGETVTLEEPDNIAAVIGLHESIVENKAWHESFDGGDVVLIPATEEIKYTVDTLDAYAQRIQNCWIDYLRADGSTISRRYALYYVEGDPSTYGDTITLQNILNCQEAVEERKATAFQLTAENIIDGRISAQVFADEAEGLENVYSGREDFYDVEIGEYLGDLSRAEEDRSYKSTYTWCFTAEELEELYYTCILPDIANGTLGHIWLITDEDYYATVYDARIDIDARIPRPTGQLSDDYSGSYIYEYFYTYPTVDSVRTNAWLAEHGIPLHTFAEFQHAGK